MLKYLRDHSGDDEYVLPSVYFQRIGTTGLGFGA